MCRHVALLCSRSLQCSRITIHKNLVASFIVRSVAVAVMFEPLVTGRQYSYRNIVRHSHLTTSIAHPLSTAPRGRYHGSNSHPNPRGRRDPCVLNCLYPRSPRSYQSSYSHQIWYNDWTQPGQKIEARLHPYPRGLRTHIFETHPITVLKPFNLKLRNQAG